MSATSDDRAVRERELGLITQVKAGEGGTATMYVIGALVQVFLVSHVVELAGIRGASRTCPASRPSTPPRSPIAPPSGSGGSGGSRTGGSITRSTAPCRACSGARRAGG